VEVVAWAILARSATVCLVLYWMSGRPLPAPVSGMRSSEAWRTVTPLLMGSALYKTGPLIDRFWTSQAPTGSVTVFNLAQTGMAGVAAVLDRAFTVSAVPRLARLAEQRDGEGMRSVYRGCILRTTLVIGVLSLALLAAYPIWPWLLSATLRFQPPIAHQMWIVLLLLLGYLHVASCGSVVMQAFYALGDTRLPVQVSSVMFILGAIVKSVAFVGFGMYGLALATSAYYLGNLGIMCFLLERRIGVQFPARS
jgi:putative peptidoglycan lipid II flippase